MVRDTARYELWCGRQKAYIGVTNNLDRRIKEHAQEGFCFTKVVKVGPKVTRDSALDWEQRALEGYRRGHGGDKPPGHKQ